MNTLNGKGKTTRSQTRALVPAVEGHVTSATTSSNPSANFFSTERSLVKTCNRKTSALHDPDLNRSGSWRKGNSMLSSPWSRGRSKKGRAHPG